MKELCDLKVHINGEQAFFVNQRTVCSFSGKLRRLVKHEKKKSSPKGPGMKISDFPGGATAFELAVKFCYGGGRISLAPSNVALLHSAAIYLEMSEDVSACNLLTMTETFMDGLFYWTWDDVITALRTCEAVVHVADASGLLHKLIASLLSKIAANSELPLTTSVITPFASSSSSSSSPDTAAFRRSISMNKTPETSKFCFTREWWFDDLALLPPTIIEKIMKTLGAYGADNKNLILTKFLLHYLKSSPMAYKLKSRSGEYSGLAETAVHGVVLIGRNVFSCRGLFWVLRIVSGFGLSRESKESLERLMGLMLEQATLDDLLVSGMNSNGGVYDVSLVVRLVRVFVESSEGCVERLKKVGRLIDKYLGEISPDQNLRVSKFLAVAESLPDSARDCFDGVYRALDIYLESHPLLSSEDRMRLCRCLNYEKLTLEASKDLAKNPRISPRIAMQALVSQKSKIHTKIDTQDKSVTFLANKPRKTVYKKIVEPERLTPEPFRSTPEDFEEKEELRLNLQRMQNRVMELERACRQMKGHMSRIAKNKPVSSSPSHQISRGLPRLC